MLNLIKGILTAPFLILNWLKFEIIAAFVIFLTHCAGAQLYGENFWYIHNGIRLTENTGITNLSTKYLIDTILCLFFCVVVLLSIYIVISLFVKTWFVVVPVGALSLVICLTLMVMGGMTRDVVNVVISLDPAQIPIDETDFHVKVNKRGVRTIEYFEENTYFATNGIEREHEDHKVRLTPQLIKELEKKHDATFIINKQAQKRLDEYAAMVAGGKVKEVVATQEVVEAPMVTVAEKPVETNEVAISDEAIIFTNFSEDGLEVIENDDSIFSEDGLEVIEIDDSMLLKEGETAATISF